MILQGQILDFCLLHLMHLVADVPDSYLQVFLVHLTLVFGSDVLSRACCLSVCDAPS